MKHQVAIVYIFFTFFICVTECYPTGAPVGTCSSMTPHHRGSQPQTSPSPFIITATVSETNDSIEVTIQEQDKRIPFKGFLLQAYFHNNTFFKDGTFTSSENSKLLGCAGKTNNALTHNSGIGKVSLTTVWIPPANIYADVIFKATVVEKFDRFWLGVSSNRVSVYSTQTAASTKQTEISTGQVQNIYSQCGFSRGCFGLPSNCFDKQICEGILTYYVVNDVVQFEMVGALGTKSGWIAMGLSRNSKMGDDSVTECIILGGEVVVRESWNVDKPRKNNVVLRKGTSSITEAKGRYEDGVMTCQWQRPFNTTVNNQNFDLLGDQYYVLLAKGPVDAAGNKVIHSVHLASAQTVNLTAISLVAGKSTLLIKTHGAFMTAAWVGFVSIAILLARHYKEVWMRYKLCGTDVWFSVHRCFMLLSVALALSAFIAIFIDVDGWSDVGSNPHPIIGCISTGLIVVQPVIAVFRPSPLSPKRPIFRWVHGLIGNGAQITAFVNLFLAVSLKGSNLPQAFYWVLVTFLIFHCLVHLLIHLHSCFMEREREKESNMKLNQFQLGDGYDLHEDSPGSSFKKFALGLYTMVNIGLTVALILMICLN